MTKLTSIESQKYSEAERLLSDMFGGAQCLWETTKPKFAINLAAIAGFKILYNGMPRYVILEVYKGGNGWEIFGCPSAFKIDATFDALKVMWPKVEAE